MPRFFAIDHNPIFSQVPFPTSCWLQRQINWWVSFSAVFNSQLVEYSGLWGSRREKSRAPGIGGIQSSSSKTDSKLGILSGMSSWMIFFYIWSQEWRINHPACLSVCPAPTPPGVISRQKGRRHLPPLLVMTHECVMPRPMLTDMLLSTTVV